ncbi:phospholipase D family protein [Mesorhizobium sp. 1B3]|uniref:phospholipase D family protein n=1 Tax=Mesorhizobium sp. 1B3 TaxID=3243599 RepID=UPI003D98E074
MLILLIVAIILGLFCLASFLAVYSYGLFAAHAKGEPSFALSPAGEESAIGRTALRLAEGREGASGLVLLPENLDAFAARALAARHAGSSLDLMYYLWHNDLTGRMLANEVVKAADRGVRVRLLLDDINTRGSDAAYLSLDSHPNISVRIFNPSRAREGALQRGLEMALRAFSVTRRMHNKAWIADGALAIVGGRNIGDEYFDAAETNFRDLDVLLVGETVAETRTIFDAFWNSDAAIPIRALAPLRKHRLRRLRKSLAKLMESNAAHPYFERVRRNASVASMIEGRLHWTSSAAVISDPPEKAAGERRENWLLSELTPAISSSERRLEITSPYFIPGVEGSARLQALAHRGVDVAVLTNSLAATDVAAVHGAYSKYRLPLLEDGIRLYELRPYAGSGDISVMGSKGASLHTKAFTVDDRLGFIGSFNFDPRSASLNTEMGVLFEQADLVAEIRKEFQRQTSPGASYRLMVEEGRVVWRDGTATLSGREPAAGWSRRLMAWTIGLLPIESQL